MPYNMQLSVLIQLMVIVRACNAAARHCPTTATAQAAVHSMRCLYTCFIHDMAFAHTGHSTRHDHDTIVVVMVMVMVVVVMVMVIVMIMMLPCVKDNLTMHDGPHISENVL